MKRNFEPTEYYDYGASEKFSRTDDYTSPYGSTSADYTDNGYFAQDDSFAQDGFGMSSSVTKGGYQQQLTSTQSKLAGWASSGGRGATGRGAAPGRGGAAQRGMSAGRGGAAGRGRGTPARGAGGAGRGGAASRGMAATSRGMSATRGINFTATRGATRGAARGGGTGRGAGAIVSAGGGMGAGAFGGGLRGRGRGGGIGSSTKFIDKIVIMKDFIKKESSSNRPSDCVPIIDRAASKGNMKISFEHEEIELTAKKITSGCLIFEKKPMVRCHGPIVKTVRHGVYTKLWNIFLTLEPREIVAVKSGSHEAAKEEFASRVAAGETDDEIIDSLKEEVLVSGFKPDNTRHGFQRFQDYLLDQGSGSQIPKDVVPTFSQSLVNSKSGLVKVQKEEIYHLPVKGIYHRSILFINDIPVASARGRDKKQVKMNLFAKAYSNFVNLPLDLLVKGVDIDGDVFEPEAIIKGYAPVEYTSKLPFEKKLEVFAGAVKSKPELLTSGQSKEFLATIENIGLKASFVFTKKENIELVSCEMYLDNVFIASSPGEGKFGSQANCMQAAVTTFNTQTADVIDKFNKRFVDDEVIPNCRRYVERKGVHSNIDKILSKKRSINYGPLGRSAMNIIIVELDIGDNIKNHSQILMTSATRCGLYLEFIGSKTMCKVMIEGEEVSSGTGTTRVLAQRNAAVVALYNLYESQPVIKEVLAKDQIEKRAIPFQKIVELAASLKRLNAPLPDDILNPAQDTNQDGDVKTNPYIVLAMQQKINDYLKTQSLQDLVFGTGFDDYFGEVQLVKTYNTDDCFYKLVSVDLKQYLRVTQQIDPYKIMNILKTNPSGYVAYRIVPKAELPKKSDLEKINFQEESDI